MIAQISSGQALCLITFLTCFYFTPAVLGASRKHAHTAALFAANLFFGWTGIGWVLCFIWALMRNQKPG